MTTTGAILAQPLAKAQCGRCALVQRSADHLLGHTDFYEKRYDFFERPGADRFDRPRYAAMAGWISSAVPFLPTSVLDAGCGRGWMMEALQEVYPNARFTGIEPSEAESAHARGRGLDVLTGRVGALGAAPPRVYDLVYSTNVLEHTTAPIEFLIGLRAMLAPSGLIVITCPDASQPGSEMMFADQNFSFLPVHLGAMAAAAGLAVTARAAAPSTSPALRDKHLVVLRAIAENTARVTPVITPDDAERLYARRCAYFEAWRACAAHLAEATGRAGRVYNFGTSTWSFLLAGYCKEYWARVHSCVIDGGAGRFIDKPVEDAGRLTPARGDAIVFGVDPAAQQRFAARFSGTEGTLVTWNTIVER